MHNLGHGGASGSLREAREGAEARGLQAKACGSIGEEPGVGGKQLSWGEVVLSQADREVSVCHRGKSTGT